MEPQNWPKAFTYSSTSISSDVHPQLLQHFFLSDEPKHKKKISPCIEEGRVHLALRIEKITPELHYKGPKPHPLAGKEAFEGHPQHGVFATSQIPKYIDIGEYVGEIHFGDPKNTGPTAVYCWRVLINGLILNIYSRKVANELCFINDYRGLSEGPNVQTTLIIHKGRFYFGYSTLRAIEPFEELLIDYGATWEKQFK